MPACDRVQYTALSISKRVTTILRDRYELWELDGAIHWKILMDWMSDFQEQTKNWNFNDWLNS